MKRPILAATLLTLFGACSVESGGGEEPTGIDAGADSADASPAQPDAGGTVGDVATYCNEWGAIICSQLFACLTPEQREEAGVPATEPECLAAEQDGCDTASSADICEDGTTYQPDQAMPCVTQFAALTCEQFLDPDPDTVLAEAAPACLALCQ